MENGNSSDFIDRIWAIPWVCVCVLIFICLRVLMTVKTLVGVLPSQEDLYGEGVAAFVTHTDLSETVVGGRLETQTQTYVWTGKRAACLAACPWAAPDKTSRRLVNKRLWHCQIISRPGSQLPGFQSVYSYKLHELGWRLLASGVRSHSWTKSTC